LCKTPRSGRDTLSGMMLPLMLAGALQVPPPVPSDVAWIAGCWESTRNGRHVVEQWLPPEGGTMMGVSRTVADGRTTEWEFLIIRAGANGLDYVAHPSGQAEATFTAARASGNEVVFENAAHDFPQRITYKRQGDALLAAVEGTRNGKTRRIEYPYTKGSCAATR
jgi:hypothetical protein